ncbi:MAG: aconitase X catalytic domain-containing protein [Desulfurococcaceae archaeon]
MYLNSEQEKMLRGDYGWATAKAIELLVRIGEAVGAKDLIEVKHVHVSGVSYTNIGKYGLDLILDFYRNGGRSRVFTTINPGCVDYSGLSGNIIDNSFIDSQREIDSALIGMGFKPTYTCIPYYYRFPLPAEHLAWGESSAVIFANSIYGAFTNREAGPVALASSITGYTYNSGLHLLENRVAKVHVKVPKYLLSNPPGAIGLWLGEHVKEPPYLEGLAGDLSEIKLLLSSMAASGNHALAVLSEVTPHNTYRLEIEEKVEVDKFELEDYTGEHVSRGERVLGYIGCPHLHPWELLNILRHVRKCRGVKRGELLITIPPEYLLRLRSAVYALKALGVNVATGTCPIVSRLSSKFDIVLTNSGKAAFYLKRIHGIKVGLAKTEEVIRHVCRASN